MSQAGARKRLRYGGPGSYTGSVPRTGSRISMSRGSSVRSSGRPYMPRAGWSVRRYAGYRKLDRSDYKFVDLASATYANNTTGSVTLVATIPQGSSVNTRDGKSCQLTSVRVRGRIVADTTATTQGVACALVWDRQPNKALAAITDVYDVITTNNFPNRENSGRFRIIKEWRDVLNGNSATPASGPTILNINEYISSCHMSVCIAVYYCRHYWCYRRLDLWCPCCSLLGAQLQLERLMLILLLLFGLISETKYGLVDQYISHYHCVQRRSGGGSRSDVAITALSGRNNRPIRPES